MPNEFVARNGIIALNNTIITGSLNVSSGITGSLFGTASWATNALTSSYILNAVSASFASTASSVNPLNQNVIITGSLTVNGTSATIKANGNSYGGTSFVNGTWGYTRVGILGEPTIVMASNVQSTTQTLIGVTIPATSSALLFSSGYGFNVGNNYQIISVGTLGVRVNNTTQALTIPTSGIVTANQGLIISGSLTVITGSGVELQVTNTGVTIGNAITDTHTVTGSLNISGSITTTGTITAQTLVVQTVTSSVSFMTGSTRFGSLLANTHQFTGSVSMTGSLTTVGTASFNGPVGIGTTSPSTILDANGAAAVVSIRDTNGTNNSYFGAFTDYLQLAVNRNPSTGVFYNTSKAASQISLFGGASDSHILFYTTDTNNAVPTERMRIDKSGNVGIGTTSPSSKLSIAADDALRLQGNVTYMSFFNGANTVRSGYLQINAAGVGTYLTDEVNGAINFSAGGSIRQIITAAGNVGIGTTSPSNLFEVNGISAVVNSFGAFTALQASGSTGYRWTLANDASFRLQYTTNGFAGLAGTPMYISSSGNVGIGTTSPAFPLDVNGGIAVGGARALYNAATDNIYLNARVLQNQSNVVADGMYIGYDSFGTTNAHLRFYANGVNERMRIDASTGNVGIGTTSPQVKLDVVGTSTGTLTGMALFRDASTNGNGLVVRAGTGRVDLLATWINSGINTDLTFTPTTSGGTQNEAMRITSAGNVGIGTTSPSSKLHVVGSTTSLAQFTGPEYAQIRHSDGTRTLYTQVYNNIGVIGMESNSPLAFNTNNTEQVRITSTGNVGIGTTSPAYKLDVSGSDASINGVRVGRGAGSISTNTAVGSQALNANTTGNGNVAVGLQALTSNTTGISNVAIGNQALYVNVSGGSNTVIGYGAGLNSEGSSNIIIGNNTDINKISSNNTIIGTNAGYKPDGTVIDGDDNVLSISTIYYPEIWGKYPENLVAPQSSAEILKVNGEFYSGAVVDYSIEADDVTQRTGTIWITFDYNGNYDYNDTTVVSIGDTSWATFTVSTSSPYMILTLDNTSAEFGPNVVAVISCRLLKRYFVP